MSSEEALLGEFDQSLKGTIVISFRSIDWPDETQLLHWRNAPHVSREHCISAAIDSGTHRNWFTRMMEMPDRHAWVVNLGNLPVGCVMIHSIDDVTGIARTGFYIGEESALATGVGVAMEMFLLDACFAEFSARRAVGEVLASNSAALRLHDAFGWTREGLLREQIVRDSETIDVVLIGILRSEWASPQNVGTSRLYARSRRLISE